MYSEVLPVRTEVTTAAEFPAVRTEVKQTVTALAEIAASAVAADQSEADCTEGKSEFAQAEPVFADQAFQAAAVSAVADQPEADCTEGKSEFAQAEPAFGDQAFWAAAVSAAADQPEADCAEGKSEADWSDIVVCTACYSLLMIQAERTAAVQTVLPVWGMMSVAAEGICFVVTAGAAEADGTGTVHSELVQSSEQERLHLNTQAFRMRDRSGFAVEVLYRIYHKNQPF